MPKPRGAIYARASRTGESDTTENQIRDATRYLEGIGATLDMRHVYCESGESGADADRQAFQRMMHDGSKHRWDVLVFRAPSRLTRRGVESAFFIFTQMRGWGRSWHCMDYPVLSSDTGTPAVVRDVFLAILAALDEDYRRNISIRTKAALKRLKDQGKKLGRHPKGCTCSIHFGHSDGWDRYHSSRKTRSTRSESGATVDECMCEECDHHRVSECIPYNTELVPCTCCTRARRSPSPWIVDEVSTVDFRDNGRTPDDRPINTVNRVMNMMEEARRTRRARLESEYRQRIRRSDAGHEE